MTKLLAPGKVQTIRAERMIPTHSLPWRSQKWNQPRGIFELKRYYISTTSGKAVKCNAKTHWGYKIKPAVVPSRFPE